MAKCEKLKSCPFFNGRLANMPSVSELLKQTYCFGEKNQCARYKVSTAGLDVPPDLFPNDASRAKSMLEAET